MREMLLYTDYLCECSDNCQMPILAADYKKLNNLQLANQRAEHLIIHRACFNNGKHTKIDAHGSAVLVIKKEVVN